MMMMNTMVMKRMKMKMITTVVVLKHVGGFLPTVL